MDDLINMHVHVCECVHVYKYVHTHISLLVAYFSTNFITWLEEFNSYLLRSHNRLVCMIWEILKRKNRNISWCQWDVHLYYSMNNRVESWKRWRKQGPLSVLWYMSFIPLSSYLDFSNLSVLMCKLQMVMPNRECY